MPVSQHCVHTRYRNRAVVVVAGYDRPLRDLFLQVLGPDDEDLSTEERVLYTSLQEPARDWTDINTVADKLAELAINVPISLLEAVYLDQLFNVGNRVAWHHNDPPPQVSLTD